MTNRSIPPSERATARADDDQKRKEAQTAEADKLKRAMRAVFESPDGLVVLNWLKKECQFGEPILGAMSGTIDEKATLYQAMRLNLYLKIRKMLTFNILKEVEYNAD